MKKFFYLIVFLSTVFASAQGLEPKTYVGNGVVIGPKTTTEINALTVTPNGYIQVNETTGTIFLRIGGSWINTGLASNISITDSGDNFTATDVEGALAELATNSSDDQTAAEVTVSASPLNYIPDDTSVEGHLAGIDDQLADYTDSGQSLSPTTKSAGVQETYDNSDITNGGSAIAERKWNKHTTNDTILLGTGITRYNQPWLETLAGADSLYIKKDTGTTIYISDSTSAISGNGAILKGGRKSATIVAESSNVFYIFGEVTVHNEAVESPELYTVANALSTTNEADAITGLSLPSGGTLTSIESSPSPQDGTSVIRFVEASAPDRIEISLTLEVGAVYDISYWAWNAGASGSAQTWVGFDEAYSQAFTSTPTQYSTSVTANSTSCTLRFYINTAGNTIYLDGLSVKKQL